MSLIVFSEDNGNFFAAGVIELFEVFNDLGEGEVQIGTGQGEGEFGTCEVLIISPAFTVVAGEPGHIVISRKPTTSGN